MADELEYCHLPLNGQRHPAEAAVGTGGWLSDIDAVDVRQTASLGDVGCAFGHDLDCHQLMGDAMASKADTSRRALPQRFAQLPWSDMGLELPGAGCIRGNVRELRNTPGVASAA